MEQVRIQDDLFTAVNGEWIEKAEIPADKPAVGGFADLDTGVEKLLISDFNKMIEEGKYPDVYLERACKLFMLAKDVKKRNRQGIKPALKAVNKVDKKIKDLPAFNRNLKLLVEEGYPLPFSMFVYNDMKDTDHHLLYIGGPSTILPDTTYYLENMAQQKAALLGMWSNMAKAVLAKTELSPEEQAKYLEDTLKFDAVIATLVKSSLEKSEYVKMYNVVPTKRACTQLRPIKLKKGLEKIFGFVPEKVSITEPRFVKGFKTLFSEETFEQYKHWAYVKALLGSTSYLSEELREIGSSYRRALAGIAQMPSVEKFAYRLASGMYSEPVGKYYGEKYFGEKAKKDVTEIVKDIIETYKKRIKANDFLCEETKKTAILKLSKMGIKMGYPDKVDKIYESLVFDEKSSLFDAASALEKVMLLDELSKLNKPYDRSQWSMPGHMVNACFTPTSNEITFPAAILQAPFYSINQTRSQNLGGIGAVIGHEISHAFDNNGSKCDEKGNIADWWTKEDNKNFNKKIALMVKQFEGIELPFGKVNAKLIVSENIADNGGVAVTLDIMSNLKGANYEEYFVNWAKVWCQKAKPEYQALLLNVDVHGPHILRANMPPRNFEEWYTTFNVTKKDKMYIAPNKRLVIW